MPSRLRLGVWSRIHPLPPEKSTCESKCFFQRNPPAAEEIHLRWMKSLRDEIPLRGEMEADFISSEAVGRRFHPSSARISSCEARFHNDFGGHESTRSHQKKALAKASAFFNEIRLRRKKSTFGG